MSRYKVMELFVSAFRLIIFHKISFVYHLIKEFERKCYMTVLHTANVYRALWGVCRFFLLWGDPVILTDYGEIL